MRTFEDTLPGPWFLPTFLSPRYLNGCKYSLPSHFLIRVPIKLAHRTRINRHELHDNSLANSSASALAEIETSKSE